MRARDLLARKLERVRALFDLHRARLQQDEDLKDLLSRYLRAFADTEAVAREVGLSDFCARCGREGWGTCCGEDMEFHCEDVLLLANLLLGVEFPTRRHQPKGCYFLGEEGCLLKVRPLICRNFICPELADHLGPENIRKVQQALGPEAETLFLLCLRLKRLCPEI
ncbi:MAG: hypothetical protein GXO17_00305 [Thermodesulfobacteria bacterium]|nr:hypothetical protein [Thermodesulfobacteriota bacterium]